MNQIGTPSHEVKRVLEWMESVISDFRELKQQALEEMEDGSIRQVFQDRSEAMFRGEVRIRHVNKLRQKIDEDDMMPKDVANFLRKRAKNYRNTGKHLIDAEDNIDPIDQYLAITKGVELVGSPIDGGKGLPEQLEHFAARIDKAILQSKEGCADESCSTGLPNGKI